MNGYVIYWEMEYRVGVLKYILPMTFHGHKQSSAYQIHEHISIILICFTSL